MKVPRSAASRKGVFVFGILMLACVTAVAQDIPSTIAAASSVSAPPDSVWLGFTTSSHTRVIPPSLTGKQRWDKYVRDTFTTAPIYFAAFGAALGDQASNTPKPWGRNIGGYAKRAGTEYATFAIQTSLYQGGSALLHNQGEYVPCQCSGGWHRAGYALEMTFLTYHDGHKVLDAPQFVAAYGAGMIPVLWYPTGYSPTVQGVQNGSVQMGVVAGVREIQEFAPELKRFFSKFKP